MSNYTITADSLPDYDDWGIDSYWSKEDWKKWYDLMVAKYGVDKARSTWISAYDRPGHLDILPARGNYIMDSNFADWMKQNDLYEGVATGFKGVSNDLVLGAEKISRGAIRTAENAAGGAFNTLNVASKILPVILVVVVGIVLIVGYKYLTQKLNVE